jgi:hypothetical protein
VKRRVDPALGLGIFAVVLAGLFGVLAVVDPGRLGPEAPPPRPYTVDAAVTPAEAQASAAPRNAAIGRSGRLTIVEAPATRGTLAPRRAGERGADELAREAAPVSMGMLAGIRGFYRVDPLPPEELQRPITITLEYVPNRAPLVLVDGCFRFGGREGPWGVFPPDARLGLIDGYLVVGPPGLPARYSARVGEVIAWEGKQVRALAAAAKDKVRERCGAGEVISVMPWSASVQQAETDSWVASEIAAKLKLSFDRAVALLRRCGDRARHAVRGGPISMPIEEACRLAHPQPIAPPPAPLPQRR